MTLVDYSDSDESDVEQSSAKPATTGKPTFQKVVDRSNPGKIKVSLPSLKNDAGDEPPAKRIKVGGSGGLCGFNSLLPAPKRTGQAAGTSIGGGGVKRGLGAGVSLKTGAAPGFSRQPEPAQESYDDNEKEGEAPGVKADVEQQKPSEVKLVGKPTMFMPLSVSRKPAKKKKTVAAPATPVTTTRTTAALTATPQAAEKPASRPKVSMFSLAPETSALEKSIASGEYKPMMLEPEYEVEEESTQEFEPSYEDYTPNHSFTAPPAVPTPPISQSLDDIAGDLNLSAAERRQLFGRQKGGRGVQSATKIINFNTDQEYLHNEELRASGEQVVHNPVRAIAPGKHSLKQLVNAAQSQKDALEESFAKGKSNRAEASSRYGW
ncbi:mitotic checkpoint regulator, MAD2B-interacting-domain-containing protein [Bisporella sp. PMI_857]|nr:mitotic checkpoint regulator, MAD2B-interacting-domain-containing protein [Bisporella sp. PMI_857]